MPELKVTQQHLKHDAYLYVSPVHTRARSWRIRRVRNASMPCVIAQSR